MIFDSDTQKIQKVLLSLLAATVVAISEVTLYIIWESRRHPAKINTHKVLSLGGRPVHSTISCNDVGRISSNSACLDNDSLQSSTSIDTHQPSGGKALRHRIRVKSKSPSR
jgi:hypothetical protein